MRISTRFSIVYINFIFICTSILYKIMIKGVYIHKTHNSRRNTQTQNKLQANSSILIKSLQWRILFLIFYALFFVVSLNISIPLAISGPIIGLMYMVSTKRMNNTTLTSSSMTAASIQLILHALLLISLFTIHIILIVKLWHDHTIFMIFSIFVMVGAFLLW